MGDPKRISSPVSSSSFSCPRPEQNPLVMDPELWLMAEHRIHEILCSIQPAFASERKRHDVISYLTRLIKAHYTTEVFAFGSVPFKTYLPDGDIDLTILSHQPMEKELAEGVLNHLEKHVHDPRFKVKNVQYIEAQAPMYYFQSCASKEQKYTDSSLDGIYMWKFSVNFGLDYLLNLYLGKVKVIKCLVNEMSVDISFNQLAGLSALCFLEQANQIFGKDHLLKRGIILIKSWCFYESRILGAIHGLISTYALEILVLHIINLFHSSLGSPLAVLYKFLDYYSSFDWENCGVSINGVIVTSYLPNIVVKPPGQGEDPSLLGPSFLGYCNETYAVPVKALDRGKQEFIVKPMNIVDPLKENNNLGRSVSQANFHRIKCALSYGARRLRQILRGPGGNLGKGLETFFVNTLDRNGRGVRPDANVPVPPFGTGRSEVSDLFGDHVTWCRSGLLQGQWYHHYTLPDHFHQLLSLRPQTLSRGSGNVVLPGSLQHRQTVLHHPGTKAFLQRGLPKLCPCPAVKCRKDAPENPRVAVTSIGTGTFIPNTVFYGPIFKGKSPDLGQENRPAGMNFNSIDLGLKNFPSLLSTGNPAGVVLHFNNWSTFSIGESSKTSSDSSSPNSEPTSLVGGSQDDSLIPSSVESSVTRKDEKTAELEIVDVPGERVAKEDDKGKSILKSEDFPALTKLG